MWLLYGVAGILLIAESMRRYANSGVRERERLYEEARLDRLRRLGQRGDVIHLE